MLYYNVKLDISGFEVMVIGFIVIKFLGGVFILYGVKKVINVEVLIVKIDVNNVSVFIFELVIVNSVDFDLNVGIEILCIIVNFIYIFNMVLVYFCLIFSCDGNVEVVIIFV